MIEIWNASKRLALALAVATVPSAPLAAAEPQELAETVTFEGVALAREETGELKARSLFSTVTLCEFGMYTAAGDARPGGPRLLVLRFARKLSAEQMQQVFRGVVDGRSGYSTAELESFLDLLPDVKTGAIVRFRSDATGKLEVFSGDTLVGSVAAPGLAAAVWAGLGEGAE